QRNLDDFGAAARSWNRLGERLDVWAQGNLENLTRAIDNLNNVLTRVASVFNEQNQKNLANILQNTSAASQRFDSISRNLDSLIEDARPVGKHLNDTLTRMDLAMDDLRKTYTPYMNRSESTSRNLDESMAKLNRM